MGSLHLYQRFRPTNSQHSDPYAKSRQRNLIQVLGRLSLQSAAEHFQNLVGDEVELLEVKGIVENVGLRITTVRAQDGVVWYLRNGEILKVGNRSQ